jgi:hypothetical protein
VPDHHLAHLLDELRLVLEPVADQRELAPEDFAVHSLLDLAQQVIQPVHHRAHVGQQVNDVELPLDVRRGQRDRAGNVFQISD